MSRARVINIVCAALLGCAATLSVAWSAAAFDPELPVPPSAPLLVQTTSGAHGRIYATTRDTRWRTRIDLLWSPETEAETNLAGRASDPPASSASAEGSAEGMAEAALSWPPDWAMGVDVAPLPNTKWGFMSMFVVTGWPLRCLAGAATLGDRLMPYASPSVPQMFLHRIHTSHAVLLDSHAAIDLGSFLHASRLIPLRVLWGAFAVNALLFTLVFAAPYEIARFVQRRRRVALNLCPSCGYALIGASNGVACPECGAARPPR